MAITTAPRKPSSLLSKTVESLRAGGFGHFTIFAEPGSDLAGFDDVQVFTNHEKLGPWRNWRQALRFIASVGADFYAIAQDDIIVRPNLRQYLEKTVKTDNVYSPYTSGKDATRSGRHSHDGWFHSSSGWEFCGALFYVFSPNVAAFLNGKLPGSVRDNKHIDAHVAEISRRNGYGILVHKPSLVQHTGDDSTMGYPRGDRFQRSAAGFVNEPLQIELGE